MRNPLRLLLYCAIFLTAFAGTMSVTKVSPSPIVSCRADPTVDCLTNLAVDKVLSASELSKQKNSVSQLIRLGNFDQISNLMNEVDLQQPNGNAGFSYQRNSLLGLKAYSEIKRNQDISTTLLWIKNIENQSLPLGMGPEKALSVFYFLGLRLLGGEPAGHICEFNAMKKNNVSESDKKSAFLVLERYLEILDETLGSLSKTSRNYALSNAADLASKLDDVESSRELLSQFSIDTQALQISYPVRSLVQVMPASEVLSKLDEIGNLSASHHITVAKKMIEGRLPNKKIIEVLERAFELAKTKRVGLNQGSIEIDRQREIVTLLKEIGRTDLAVTKAHEMQVHIKQIKTKYPEAYHADVAATFIDLGLLTEAELELKLAKKRMRNITSSKLIPQMVRLGQFDQSITMLSGFRRKQQKELWQTILSSDINFLQIEEMFARAPKFISNLMYPYAARQIALRGDFVSAQILISKFYRDDMKSDNNNYLSAAVVAFQTKDQKNHQEALRKLVDASLFEANSYQLTSSALFWKKCAPDVSYH